MEKRMMLEDPKQQRRSETNANDMEGTNSQEGQNQRRAVVTGFHDDTTVQEVQDTLKEIRTTIGMPMDQVSNQADHTCVFAIQRQRLKFRCITFRIEDVNSP